MVQHETKASRPKPENLVPSRLVQLSAEPFKSLLRLKIRWAQALVGSSPTHNCSASPKSPSSRVTEGFSGSPARYSSSEKLRQEGRLKLREEEDAVPRKRSECGNSETLSRHAEISSLSAGVSTRAEERRGDEREIVSCPPRSPIGNPTWQVPNMAVNHIYEIFFPYSSHDP